MTVRAELFAGMTPHSWAVTGWAVAVFLAIVIVAALIWQQYDRRNP